MIEIEIIETSSLGDRSYLAHDGEVAVVVDPQRDIDRVLDLAADRGVRITHVLETHVHNDYVTGGLELAGRTGATYVLPAGSDVEFDHSAVGDGDVIEAGQMRVRVLHTPGHTHHHVSYVLTDAGGQVQAVFTGGSMLYGATGRTDLVGPERHRRADPRPVPLGAPAGRRATRRRRGVPDPRVRQLLLGHPDQRQRLHRRRAGRGSTRR